MDLDGDSFGVGWLAGVESGVPGGGVLDQQGGTGRVVKVVGLHANTPPRLSVIHQLRGKDQLRGLARGGAGLKVSGEVE